MTPTVKRWIDKRTRGCSSETRFLEIGSRNINGAPERRSAHYIGVDLIQASGVDCVADGHCLPFRDSMFDVVICAEVLEHDRAPWITATEIYRVSQASARILVTVPGIGFPRHNYPSDYWRFTTDGLELLFNQFHIMELINDSVEKAVMLHATKC